MLKPKRISFHSSQAFDASAGGFEGVGKAGAKRITRSTNSAERKKDAAFKPKASV